LLFFWWQNKILLEQARWEIMRFRQVLKKYELATPCGMAQKTT
jgi:hypothetical protein